MTTQIEHEAKNLGKIRAVSLYGFLFDCKGRKRYSQMMQKARSTVKEELDLVKFIRRQRFLTTATLAQLNTRQQVIMQKFSSLQLHESSSDF